MADFYGDSTNMKAEALALMQGLQLCYDVDCRQVEIEVDCLALVLIIRRKSQVPWSISYEV